ncbi:MAG TPA: NAD(+)/NADH kinase [Bryobacteraceae bacterium]|nr:NAD(+)/NADH kinase [Bryobacteraceae bacterium]
MRTVHTIGIISKPDAPQGGEVVPSLLAWLAEHKLTARYDHVTASYAGRDDGLPLDQVPENCDMVIVLGGDGTLLIAAKAIGEREIPLLAVNLGSLGFLTALTVEELFPELERALKGRHRIGHRRMINGIVERAGETIAQYLALNDIVMSKAPKARMVEIDAWVGHHFVCTYRGDGLILATPTGSTAYSLSSGGPIVFPTVAAFCLTPICPHTLTNRPVIVPDTELVAFSVRAPDDDVFLNIDGQQGMVLKSGDRVLCRAAKHALRLIRPPRLLYFDVMRQKLHWGQRGPG